MNLRKKAIEKLQSDLEWRGPNGRMMGYVVLERELGQALLRTMEDGYQERLVAWLEATFKPEHIADVRTRFYRLLEEVLELGQSLDIRVPEVQTLINYVYSRKKGLPFQEAGGSIVAFVALCHALNFHFMDVADTELNRCWANIDKIRVKQDIKEKELNPQDPRPGTSP